MQELMLRCERLTQQRVHWIGFATREKKEKKAAIQNLLRKHLEECKSRRIESKGKGLLQKQKAQLDFFTARRKTPALVRTKSGLNDEHANFQERQEQMREEARRKLSEASA